ncbi:MAG: ornithine cyclodeaminase [Lachnospiraceae bacterium]|nr:ornithine cyclodeaminase [Lachnospiraceae bacterium]
MNIITFNQIKALGISPSECYSMVENMIAIKSEAILPAKIHMAPSEDVFCNVMPCIIPSISMGGIKTVTRYPARIPSLDSQILLFDSTTGDIVCLMDGNWITAMRTGAVAAHSIATLAKKDFKTIGMLGLGNTARATLLVLAEKYPDRELTVKLLKYKSQEDLFLERFSKHNNINFCKVNDNVTLVKGSDVIISCATYLKDDICQDDVYDEGVLIVPVHTRGFMNCDLFFDKVFADDRSHVCGFKFFERYKYFAEMTDVVNGFAEGRSNDKERILAYNIGIAIHDIYFAAKVYKMVSDRRMAQDIDMNAPTEKFWL